MSGAKNCPETPRQKMIGMMYLVLTAMLALNVSTDILKAFKLVDDSLHSTLSSTDSHNRALMNDFRALRDENPQKNGEWYDKAAELTAQSDSLFDYIQHMKYQIAVATDGQKKADPEARVIEGNDNRDAATRYALPNRGEKPGTVLKEKIIAYRNLLISLDPAKAQEFNTTFDVSDRPESGDKIITWEDQMFHDMPSGAAVVLMTKLQNDIRNAQNDMIQYLRASTDAGDLRVNKLSAYVIPNANYVIRGSKYTAQIVLAAVDSTQRPEYYVEGQRINNNGIYEVTASSLGLKKYTGWISYQNPATGEMATLPFRSEYSVGEPAVTISNTDLNIMYRKYENKFAISVPGVSNDKIRVNVAGASVQQRGNIWVIVPNESAKTVTISVLAELDGKMQPMGTKDYRVKVLPAPGAYFKSGEAEYASDSKISRNAILNKNATVIASYGQDGLLDVPFKVTSFKVDVNGVVLESRSNKITQEQISRIEKLKMGSMVVIKDIRAESPNGERKVLTPILLTLN